MREADLERLASDLRVLDADGIGRAAWGWERHEPAAHAPFHRAEKQALDLIERSDRGPAWEAYRRRLFGLTEAGNALVAWRAQHGDRGHKAERAAFGAALALFARDGLSEEDYAALAGPMAEALPWLLPSHRPAPRP